MMGSGKTTSATEGASSDTSAVWSTTASGWLTRPKVMACALTGMIINFEFQEGKDPMGYFEYIDDFNRSTAWLLRLTKPWHNKEKRTVMADVAFGQVRAAVALMRVAGLYFIGNVKTCNKHFPQKDLREETGEYVRDRLVCLTKKATIGSGQEAENIFKA